MTAPASAVHAGTAQAVLAGRRRRARRRGSATAGLAVLVAAVFAVTLMVGHTLYSPAEVLWVLAGDTVPGASFTVGELRLPRATLGLLAGAAFGLAGVTFQTLLRNPLASPDILGITAGAGAAAVFAIIVLSWSGPAVSVVALAGALVTAAAIRGLSGRGRSSGIRLILIGIGLAAMLHSVIAYLLSRAAAWDLQAAMQWLTGSLNAASWQTVAPLAVAALILIPVLLLHQRGLAVLRLGDDPAAGLGLAVDRTRLVTLLAAVALLGVATAATGPIAFVAFLAGPIAARLVGPGGALLVPAALVGALLVLVADLVAQFAFDSRYPVGVVTGVLGAAYLLVLLARTNRSGATW